MTSPESTAVKAEKEKFEAWFASQEAAFYSRIGKSEEGGYTNTYAEGYSRTLMWHAWQARASLGEKK